MVTSMGSRKEYTPCIKTMFRCHSCHHRFKVSPCVEILNYSPELCPFCIGNFAGPRKARAWLFELSWLLTRLCHDVYLKHVCLHRYPKLIVAQAVKTFSRSQDSINCWNGYSNGQKLAVDRRELLSGSSSQRSEVKSISFFGPGNIPRKVLCGLRRPRKLHRIINMQTPPSCSSRVTAPFRRRRTIWLGGRPPPQGCQDKSSTWDRSFMYPGSIPRHIF